MTNVVTNLDEAIKNIDRYQTAVREELALAKLMTQAHAWYAVKSNDGTWLFAPSKFIGYTGNNAKAYLSEAHIRDGRSTEAALSRTGSPLPRPVRVEVPNSKTPCESS